MLPLLLLNPHIFRENPVAMVLLGVVLLVAGMMFMDLFKEKLFDSELK